MINVIRMQIYVIFKRKSTIFMYFFMYVLMLLNFTCNAFQYYGYDLYHMYSPLKMVFLGDFSPLGFYFMQYYPFLVIIPAAFTYFNDKSSNELIFIETRADKKSYYWGNIFATFITTFFIFTVPLLIEVILNCVAFPIEAVGDLTNMGMFEEVYQNVISRYLFSALWISNPYLYTVAMIVLFGSVSGILACFAAAISMLDCFKYKILIFIPVYVVLYAISAFQMMFQLKYTTNYFFYLRMFGCQEYNEFSYIFCVLAIVFCTIVLVYIKTRKDELS